MLTLQASGAVTLASQTLAVVAVAYLVGAQGQGLYISAVALQTLCYALLNVGATLGTAGQIAAAAARGNAAKTADWMAYLVKVTLLFGLGLLVIGTVALPPLSAELYGERAIGVWAGWLCVLPLVELPRVVAGVAFQGTRRMRALALLESGHELARLTLVIAGALVTRSPVGLVLGLLLGGACGSLIALALYARALRDGRAPLPGPRQLLARVPAVSLRRGARLGWRIVALKNAQILACNVVPRLILGLTVGQHWVAYYHVAERILSVPLYLTQAVGRTLLPAAGELAGLKNMRRFARLFRRVTWTTGAAVTAAIGIVLASVPWLVPRFFPQDYSGPVFLLASILALGYAPQAFAVGIDSFFIVTNRLRAWYALAFLGIAFMVPLNVWLVRTIPFTGAAWGACGYMWWNLVLLGYALWVLRGRDRDQKLTSVARYARLASEAGMHDLAFMNYGYSPLDEGELRLRLEPEEERHRCHLQLYNHLLRQVELRDKDVLEVGCGRGAGCDYVRRHLAPRTLVGIDHSPSNVELGRARFPELDLRQGDAEALPFDSACFDVVLSVESSHDYPDLWRFLAEVRRVLRPGGRFLFADFVHAAEVEVLRADIEHSGLAIEAVRDIRENVLAAIEREDATRSAWVRRIAATEERFRELASVASLIGTERHRDFHTGRMSYVSYTCRRR